MLLVVRVILGGHGIEYYKKSPTGTYASEALANYGSLKINGYDDAVSLIDKYHPEMKQVYEDYIDTVYKEGVINEWSLK
jgi:hypothetical protein